MPVVNLGMIPEKGKDQQSTINNLYDAYIALRREIEYLLENLNQDNMPSYNGTFNDGNESMFDYNGYNPACLRWFTNIWANSEFTIYNSTTFLPYLWTGAGVTSSNAATFIGERSMKITAGSTAVYAPDSTYGNTYINPSWFVMIATRGFISFWSKGGQARLKVKDNTSGNYITLKDTDGVESDTIDFTALTNWQSTAHFCTFAASTYEDLRPEISNIGGDDLYINAPQASYDRTTTYPQLYIPGKHSLGNASGGSVYHQFIYVQDDEPADAIVKDQWEDTDNWSRFDVTPITVDTTLAISDNEYLEVSGTTTITLFAATESTDGVLFTYIKNTGVGIVTIIVTGAGTIDGATTVYALPNECRILSANGTEWKVVL